MAGACTSIFWPIILSLKWGVGVTGVMMKYLAFLVILILSGCASPPKNISEFYSGEYVVRNLTSMHSVEKTHELLFQELVKCYQRKISSFIPIPAAGAIVKVSQASYVEFNILDDGTRQLALVGEAGWNRFYQQLIEIKEEANNSTLVQVYEISSAWEKHTARVAGWLKGKEAKGCGTW